MIDKKVISYYKSFFEVSKELTQKQFYDFNMAIYKVMFYEEHIDSIQFEDKMMSILWKSVKHSVDASVKGYCSKKSIPYDDMFTPLAKGVENNNTPLANNGKDNGNGNGNGNGNSESAICGSIESNEKKLTNYELFIKELKEAVQIKSKVTITKDGKSLFKSIADKQQLKSDYIRHQTDKKEFAQRITAFMEDYKQHTPANNAGRMMIGGRVI